ncbi:MAG: hypothetical protein GWN99_01600 [Gemmatimonadetes bacterium]|uniref:Uncharacterized protein n=1 Tax=Candidatus Kutchimonas denitrificans TaxID=3056748 RepID=A0AAE4Z864_9BACT|nr:hypothetical protein [Gemmatimonadota bacterium]NIR73956.1 hypothetical protein [Candidatus Kutchimonas denitrificans]NIR99762.1 hypothetical protein [Gemmatimonadota bacterium]NIT65347.1 hypothetical protein [Gemmatimonadota bacterium]NIW73796.1 hypothetical protein [Gemmatimonadota bacterium]
MNLTRVVLSVAGVPLLGGCMMMGGVGHTGSPDMMSEVDHARGARLPAPVQRAEASSEGLTIALAFPTPSIGDAVAIDAWLLTDSTDHDPEAGDIRLRIETPGGNVDQLRMRRLHSSTTATFQAEYSFSAAGLYLVTAEGRAATRADVRTVSVTARVFVGGDMYGGRHDWLMPAAILGGPAMVAMMALMMGGF